MSEIDTPRAASAATCDLGLLAGDHAQRLDGSGIVAVPGEVTLL
jgi:hypothetical protein